MTTPVTSSSVKNLGKQSPMRLGAVLLGSLLLRVAAAAGGVLIGFYLAALLETGRILSLAVVGTLGIVVNAAELGGAIPAGLLADRFSARAILVASALLGALATQLFGISGLISVFFLSRTLEGLSGSATTPAILAHLAAVTEAQPSIRGRVMSLFEVTLLGGLAAGALVGGGVWDILNTWAFSAMAALYLVVALLFWWGAGGTPTISKTALESRSPLAGLRHALQDPLLRRLAPVWLAANAVAALWLVYTPTLLTLNTTAAPTQYLVGRLTASQVGLAALVYALIFAAGILVWGQVLDRTALTRVRAMRIAIGGMFGVCLWFYLLNSSAGWASWQRVAVLIPYSLTIMVQSGVTPAALAYLADVAGGSSSRGAAMGVYTLLLGLGGIIGSALGSVLATALYFNGLLVATLILGVIGFLSLELLTGREAN